MRSDRRGRPCGALRIGTAVLSILGLASTPTIFAAEADESLPTIAEAVRVNDNNVGMVFKYEETTRLLVADMVDELQTTSDLRVVPVLSANHVESIFDLLYLSGIDLSVIHADVLEYLARTQGYYRVYDRIHGLVKLFDEKVAVIAREEIDTLDELAGRRVDFGPPGRGPDVTATLLFDTLGIDVDVVRLDDEKALARLSSGEIAATVHLTEEPLESLSALTADDGVRLLPVPREPALLAHYEPAELVGEDFPGLLGDAPPVETVSVPVIIASYNWPESKGFRYAKLQRFVGALIDSLDELRTADHESDWETVSFDEPLHGVTRLAMVETELAAAAERRRVAEEAEAMEAARRLAAEKARLRNEVADQVEALMTEVGAGDDDAGTDELSRLLEELRALRPASQ